MFPTLLLLQPSLARSLLDYRYARIEAAKERARLRGYKGAMWPVCIPNLFLCCILYSNHLTRTRTLFIVT